MKHSAIIEPIQSPSDALWIVREAGIAFLFVSGILIIAAVAVGDAFANLWLPVTIAVSTMTILTVLMLWLKSRVCAITLLVISLTAFITSVLDRLGVTNLGLPRFWVAAMMLSYAAARAVEATFKLQGEFKTAEQHEESKTKD